MSDSIFAEDEDEIIGFKEDYAYSIAEKLSPKDLVVFAGTSRLHHMIADNIAKSNIINKYPYIDFYGIEDFLLLNALDKDLWDYEYDRGYKTFKKAEKYDMVFRSILSIAQYFDLDLVLYLSEEGYLKDNIDIDNFCIKLFFLVNNLLYTISEIVERDEDNIPVLAKRLLRGKYPNTRGFHSLTYNYIWDDNKPLEFDHLLFLVQNAIEHINNSLEKYHITEFKDEYYHPDHYDLKFANVFALYISAHLLGDNLMTNNVDYYNEMKEYIDMIDKDKLLLRLDNLGIKHEYNYLSYQYKINL